MRSLTEERPAPLSPGLLDLVRRYWLGLLVALLIGLLGAAVANRTLGHEYVSRADAIVAVRQIGTVQDAVAAGTLATNAATAAKSLGESQLVAQTVAETLNDGITAGALLGKVKVDVDTGSRFIQVRARADNAQGAQTLAKEWIAALQKAFQKTIGTETIRIDPVGAPDLPTTSSGTPVIIEIAAGLAAGFGFWLVFAIFMYQRRLRSPGVLLAWRKRLGGDEAAV